MLLLCLKFLSGFPYFRIKVQVFIIASKALNVIALPFLLWPYLDHMSWLPCCLLIIPGMLLPQDLCPCLFCALNSLLPDTCFALFLNSFRSFSNVTLPSWKCDRIPLYPFLCIPFTLFSSIAFIIFQLVECVLYLPLCLFIVHSLTKNVDSIKAGTLGSPLYPQCMELSLAHSRCLITFF